ncbi:diacylglycerol/lipid kinase family protein [Ohessyouella blattaphilus]|uniref:YegS/Rv2252/BmrU family lipid kinase n=1 Tax=Ohessyouella blattaphilus TaxID=2949333 RepID=A0ABT1EE86_9FIRM|nr:YegS/Rv2252/BmrU family lipid kinase [Ohessyouella blattaphilus]MCP1109014.1 YegS/Rv2252/BmrU family lipid kinase [Ohessyouella blattaphilus]MCR8562408.1 YegS/Rv2252/BmrU family lipid kinase [Ohessyouella blattaphilus]
MKRMLFIYNPHAGRALLRTKLSDVVDIFVKAGYKVTVHPTQSFRDAFRVVKEYEADDYDLVVCSGGDGTLDEVVAAMMKREIGARDTIGYIPTGSTNDFANSLHIPKNLLQAADVAVNGAAFPCDVGRFNDDSFVYIAAFGLFTDVSYETTQEMKNILGHLAYIFEGAKRIFNVPAYKLKVEYDGNVLEDEFAYGMITNSKSVGGFKNMIGKDVAFDDGLFEVTLIKRPRNPIELQEIGAALLIEQIDTKHMYTFRASKITITSEEEIPWTLDGEFGGNHQDVEIENLKQQLTIMVPKEKIDKLLTKKHNI